MYKLLPIWALAVLFFACDSIEDGVIDPYNTEYSKVTIDAPTEIKYVDETTELNTSVTFSEKGKISAVWIKVASVDGSYVITYHTDMKNLNGNKYYASVKMKPDMPSLAYAIDYYFSTEIQQGKKIASYIFNYDNSQNNVPPEISNPLFYYTNSVPALLDTIKNEKEFLLTLNVKDDNGLADIDSVYTDLYNYQDTNNVKVTRIELFDDGKIDESGDKIAGDGIYTRKGYFPAYSVGKRKYLFVAKDRAGLISNTITHNFVVIR